MPIVIQKKAYAASDLNEKCDLSKALPEDLEVWEKILPLDSELFECEDEKNVTRTVDSR